ncbi:hypothetical protein B7P43_G02824 [Cryptotermes secundus]|uniref:Uncharacterized protein n=1 Tax=Cryptotermes secundus TaxID=105785 RepID=A0A2J7RG64_9NEOP|nr:hypothetical protein B7P43_G02824 [Cryptotermes secundus]
MTKYKIFYKVTILKQHIPVNITDHSKITGNTAMIQHSMLTSAGNSFLCERLNHIACVNLILLVHDLFQVLYSGMKH